MPRWIPALTLLSCGDPPACVLSSELDCGDCSDEPTTCAYEDMSAEGCGECETLGALYAELCDAGVRASVDKLVDKIVCEPAATP